MSYRNQFELGIAEFNEGRYFECHDTFEDLWMQERGERKRFLQGLIQGSVGVFHATRHNYTGAESQLTKSLTKLVEYPDMFLGIDVGGFRKGLEAFREFIRRSMASGNPTYDPDLIPHMNYSYDPATMSDLSTED
ncbi:MAG: DUF309 domain-containing protein [Candidatus Kapaibacterium sp.]